jgi:predicted ribosomally synthesized peptide with nif11-like leader
MSKSQLTAFLAKVSADPALKARVDAAADPDAIVAIALSQGHVFSPATYTRFSRG